MSIYTMGHDNSMQHQENDTKHLTQTTGEDELKMAAIQQSLGAIRLIEKESPKDGTVSLAQRKSGTEAYRQIKVAQMEDPFSEELAEERPVAKGLRMDKAEISKEGKLTNAKIQQQTESTDTMQDAKKPPKEAASAETEPKNEAVK